VSHDLRAPLRGIDGWSAALLEDYGGRLEGRGQEYLERVRSETQRLGRLIDDLLHLSRVSRMEMDRQRVDITALAQSVAARLTEAHPGQAIEFLIEPGLTASADEPLLDVVLTNLLDNAVKFASRRPQARVEIGQSQDHGERVFFVRDNGAGFDMAYVSALFGAFQRLHKVTEFPGTGIGLATVQRVIHRHGGRVWAESRVDAGATFFFTLGADRAGSRDKTEVTH
jgi:light-regulated signal transduction histidine kinase (bacteriophytochrome)